MAEMSAGLVNCFCGQPRVKPPLNPSAGQFAGFAGTAAGCAKLMGSPNTAAASAAAIPNAFSFMIACSPGIISPVSSLTIMKLKAFGFRSETHGFAQYRSGSRRRDSECLQFNDRLFSWDYISCLQPGDHETEGIRN